ncbi:sulfatase [Halomicrobium salinisoli]|uniref:sulfatase n=1 Tax=Halomicrobium salinisoli TaxID=2878391 RepID=UPI001CF02881|nr:sulfatase [Halomicrobium salinisoli]
MDAPNVVWITLDSVRSDHTTVGGYERDTTPAMADLGARGHAFDTCISHSKSTLPSSGAILTGLAPSRNTLGISGDVLPDGVPTVAERFSDAGYHTACLSRNSFVSPATGLDRGFDRFRWLASETMTELPPSTLVKYLLNIRRHSAGLTRDTAKHATPFLMNETARRWLDDVADEQPFFFYLHYNEPHRPYYPPLSYIDRYTDDLEMDPREAAEFALEVHHDAEEIVANGCDLSDDEWAALRAMYDAEIAYTDEMVGRLVDHVRSLPLGDTVVVVTADHGELFGEHGLLSHWHVLSDAVTRVPLVLSGLDADLAVSGDDVVQHADVMRTLLEAAGADADGTVGVDLRSESREYAVSQRGPVDFDAVYEHNEDFDASRFHLPALTSLRTETYRYQESEAGADLFALPDEVTDVSDERPDLAAELSAELDEWYERHGQPIDAGERGEFSGAVQRQLRDLGYVE